MLRNVKEFGFELESVKDILKGLSYGSGSIRFVFQKNYYGIQLVRISVVKYFVYCKVVDKYS